jgi:hypothetical protein
MLTHTLRHRSVSLYTFPPSAAITGVYYAMALWHALWNTRSRNPLWFYTSVFALILPWGIICLDSVGLAFVSYLLGIPLKDIKAGVFTDLFPVRGICNGRTVVAELVFAAMQMVLVIALFAVGVVARRRARAIQPIVDKP